MKRLLLIVFLLPLFVSAQDTLSAVDKFYSETPGAMVKKEYQEIGKVQAVAVRQYKLTNLRTNKSMYYTAIVSEGTFGMFAGFLTINADELQGIIDGIEYLSKQSYNPVNNEEYQYMTASNLKLYLVKADMQKQWRMGIGQRYYYTNEFKPMQHFQMKPSVFDELLPLLKKAKETTF